MIDDPRVQRTARGAARLGRQPRRRSAASCPELLPQVRAGLAAAAAARGRKSTRCFPHPSPPGGVRRGPADRPSCRGSPATRWRRCWAAAAWASSTGPGTCGSTAPSPSRCSWPAPTPARSERERFRGRRRLVAGLRHPNIVQVYDVGELDGRPYFTMEFVEGGSLAQTPRRHAAAGPPGRRAGGDAGRGRRRRRTAAGSSTATSSRPTSCSRPTARPRSPTSGWPGAWRAARR